jgi:hypothetical protein
MMQATQTEEPAQIGKIYAREWRHFALRYRLAQAMLFGWVPVCVGLFVLSRYWIHQPVVCLLIMAAWAPAAVAAVWWSGEFRCPRCRRRYAALGQGRHVNVTRGLFEKVCSNCKLAKFEH